MDMEADRAVEITLKGTGGGKAVAEETGRRSKINQEDM